MRFLQRFLLVFGLAALASCEAQTGGVTAQIVFDNSTHGALRRALREAAVPNEIDRLEIAVYDELNTLLDKTVLARTPVGDQLQLVPSGGSWTLDNVLAGTNRRLVVQAILGIENSRLLALQGVVEGIEVRAGETNDVGTVTLTFLPGIQLGEDMEPPAPPMLDVSSRPEGGALLVTVRPPNDPDAAGFVIAYSSTVATAPAISRERAVVLPGDFLAPDVIVVTWTMSPNPVMLTIPGLVDGTTYNVFAYSFDEDEDGDPLNYSAAAVRAVQVLDTAPPTAPIGLTITASGADSAEIRFNGPAEDPNGMGTPIRYEIKASTDRTSLGNDFDRLPTAANPLPVAPGDPFVATFTFSQLGVTGAETFYIGVRAMDEAANWGPVAFAEFTVNPNLPPVINGTFPEGALEGETVRLLGTQFETETGTVTLITRTGTISLRVLAWSDRDVAVRVPVGAPSGNVVLIRARDQRASAAFFLPVFGRRPGILQPAVGPFDIVGAPLAEPQRVSAFLDARDVGVNVELALQRIYNETPEGNRFNPFTAAETTTVAGTYSLQQDLFLFLASTNLANSLEAFLVSTSTLTPLNTRRTLTGVGNVDGLSVVTLTSTPAPDNLSVLIAASTGGRVLLSRMPDFFSSPFTPLTVSATAGADRVTAVRGAGTSSATSTLAIAYRTGVNGGRRLALKIGTGDGAPLDMLTDVQPGGGPRVYERFQMVDLPGIGVALAYEEVLADGRSDIRLLPISRFGQGPGYAPFPALVAGEESRRLEDVGVVQRPNGETWVALAISQRRFDGKQLIYAEIDPSRVSMDVRDNRRGIVLDTVLTAVNARLGCKPVRLTFCPIIWNGPSANGTLFMRR